MNSTNHKAPIEDNLGNSNGYNPSNSEDTIHLSTHPIGTSISEAMKPIRLLASQLEKKTRPFSLSFPRQIDEISESLRTFSCQFVAGLKPLVHGIMSGGTIWRMNDLANETGWILYPDISEFDECRNILEIAGEDWGRCISKIYSENWSKIGSVLKSEFLAYSLDELSKSTFCVALELHEKGKYDLVPRILFPEIERVMRIRLFNNFHGKISGQDMVKKFGRKYSLREIIGRNPIAYYTLFGELIHWVFAGENKRKTVKQHCVPNRHEVIHGFGDTLTFKDSVNMLLFASFVMGVMQFEAQDISPKRKDSCCPI